MFPTAKAKFSVYFSFLISCSHVVLLPCLGILTSPRSPFFVENLDFPTNTMDRCVLFTTAVVAVCVNVTFLVVLGLKGPVMVTAAYALTLPFGVTFDYFVHGITVSAVQIVGNILVIAAFRGLTRTEEKKSEDLSDEIDSARLLGLEMDFREMKDTSMNAADDEINTFV